MSEQERYCGDCHEGTVRLFLARVMFMMLREKGPVIAFHVAPDVWNAIAIETDYGTAPGARVTPEGVISVLGPTGWAEVRCSLAQDECHGTARREDDTMASLDFVSLVV